MQLEHTKPGVKYGDTNEPHQLVEQYSDMVDVVEKQSAKEPLSSTTPRNQADNTTWCGASVLAVLLTTIMNNDPRREGPRSLTPRKTWAQ